jgi:hypothetical protein
MVKRGHLEGVKRCSNNLKSHLNFRLLDNAKIYTFCSCVQSIAKGSARGLIIIEPLETPRCHLEPKVYEILDLSRTTKSGIAQATNELASRRRQGLN